MARPHRYAKRCGREFWSTGVLRIVGIAPRARGVGGALRAMLIYTRGGKGSVLTISTWRTEAKNVIQSESLCIKGALVAIAIVLFTSCAQVATVRNVEPVAPSVGNISTPSFPTNRDARQSPETALSQTLEIAAKAWADLTRDPANDRAVQVYNYAVGRITSLLQLTGKLPRAGTVSIRAGASAYHLTFTSEVRDFADPQTAHFIPADELAISGKYYTQRIRRDGIGAPVLAELDRPLKDARKQFLVPEKIFYSLTAVLEFRGSEARLAMEDPLTSDRISIAGRNYLLAADLSIGTAALLAKDRPQRLGFIRMIRPAKYANTARLVRLQAYDRNKIPVLVIHGLQDTPATWAPLLNELRSDPQIDRRYQFWVYNYPSGYPFFYSAALLREELDRVDQTYPDHKRIVLIGHSMGGLVARLMVTDSNLMLWKAYFGKVRREIPMDPGPKKLIERLLIFQRRAEVSRVIFISTPHRGSELASNWIGRTGIALVKLPANLTNAGDAAIPFEIKAPGVDNPNRMHFPTSIDTLSPNNRFVRELNNLPIARHIPYHSIMGDRGRGDTPNSSDGVVPYWSSHLDGAQSERIVPSDHGAHQNKEGIEEVHRILLLNLRQLP
jgi:pimeloyl-ACP methyl ester carboxylesterase